MSGSSEVRKSDPAATAATVASSTSATAAITAPQSIYMPPQATQVITAASSSTSSSSSSSHSSPYNTEWKDISLVKFGCLTVFFSTLENALFYPFYVIKTREQADNRVLGKSPWSASRAHLRTILHDQGVKGLYRGFWTSNITAFPAYGVYMGVYSWTKSALSLDESSSSTASPSAIKFSSLYAPFFAGLLADAASVALYVPGDVVVQRLQLKDSPYSSFADACLQIYKTDGLTGFFRGFGATFVTSGVASAIWWVIYENGKNLMYARMDQSQTQVARQNTTPTADAVSSSSFSSPSSSSSSSSFSSSSAATTPSFYEQLTEVNRGPQILSGFVAGTITSVLINPLDVVKTRLQVQDTYGQAAHDAASKAPSCAVPPRKSSKEPQRYKNMLHGLQRIYLDEGLQGYWRGVMPKLISRGPLSAMSSLLYEVVMYLSKSDEAIQAQHRFQQ